MPQKRIRDLRRKPTGKPARFIPPTAIPINEEFALVRKLRPPTPTQIDARRCAGWPKHRPARSKPVSVHIRYRRKVKSA